MVRSPRFSHYCMVYVFLASVLFSSTLKKMQDNSREQMHVCVIGLRNCQSAPCDVSDVDATIPQKLLIFQNQKEFDAMKKFWRLCPSGTFTTSRSEQQIFVACHVHVNQDLTDSVTRYCASRFSQFGDLYCDQTSSTSASQTQADL